MSCNEAVLARYADDAAGMTPEARAAVEAHLDACASCRAALADQRFTAATLRERLETDAPPGFVSRVSARIARETDAQSGDWLALADWRAWTAGLVPAAAALLLVALLGGETPATGSGTPASVEMTLEDWTAAAAGASASAVLQPAGGDALIEAVLTGTAPSAGGSDGR